MTTRCLTITLGPDWRSALRKAGRSATATTYQGETLNFETPGAFFGRLTERRWAIVQAPRVRQLHSQVLVFARAHFQKCHYNSANCSGAAGFSIPKA